MGLPENESSASLSLSQQSNAEEALKTIIIKILLTSELKAF